jgi:hypothetical protein
MEPLTCWKDMAIRGLPAVTVSSPSLLRGDCPPDYSLCRRPGLGFASRDLTDSKAIRMIREMPPIAIYSDKPNIIYLLTGKPAIITPTSVDPVKKQQREDLLSTINKQIRAGQAILVLFYLDNTSEIFPMLTEGLTMLKNYQGILIYGQ